MRLVLKGVFMLILVAMILAVATTLWRVGQNAKRATAQFPAEGNFVEIAGHPVHYIEMGNGPALVLIHGSSGNTRDFTFGLAEKLAQSYRVIIFDRPGLGNTPELAPFGVSVTDQAELLAFAAQAIGADKPIVAGQSLGGAIALAWAVARPDDIAAAVSISGVAYPWKGELDALTGALAHPLSGPIISRLASAWVSDEYIAKSLNETFQPQEPISGYADHIGIPLILRPSSLMANARQRKTLKEDLRAISDRYAALTLPLEIVHGDTDTIVPLHVHSKRLVEDVEGANLVTLEGIGHMPQHLSHDAVIAAIHRAASRAGLR
jgi:pimeloyl-ACP methyl ester carboxylesterase